MNMWERVSMRAMAKLCDSAAAALLYGLFLSL